MKRFAFVSTAVLFLILGITATVSAQQDDRDKPEVQPAVRQDQVTPPEEKRAQEAKAAQEEEKHSQQDAKKAQQQEKQQQKDEQRAQKEDKNNPPQAKPTQDAHRTGANTGGRIPDDKFRAHFGQQHRFRISHPTIVSGQPRFQYSGYWFVFADPWPMGWDYADDCYIDYVDGEYLLFDLAHPGVSIVVNVVL